MLIIIICPFEDEVDPNTAARAWLYDLIKEAIKSEFTQLIKAGMSMFKNGEGILAWYNKRIAIAMVEGINNKIKVIKREAYGFTDDHYFELRLLALHDAGSCEDPIIFIDDISHMATGKERILYKHLTSYLNLRKCLCGKGFWRGRCLRNTYLTPTLTPTSVEMSNWVLYLT